jgi:hypothetical protein
MEMSATFSACRRYRYDLWRRWAPDRGFAMFVGLNPSTADETADDATVRRCIAYAQDWGYGALCMTNLFAFRATRPEDLKAAKDPVGPENDQFLLRHAARASIVVAAWGNHGAHLGREAQVRALLPNLHCLRQTSGGHPGHPLYLPKVLRPIPWLVPPT